MPSRTIKVFGHSSGATITFNFNGVEVFNGNITAGGAPDTLVELFTFDISTDVVGSVTSTTTVSAGEVTLVMISANYSTEVTTETTDDEGNVFPAVTGVDLPTNFNWMSDANNLSSTNRTTDGVVAPAVDGASPVGALHNPISAGEVFTADWTINTAIIS